MENDMTPREYIRSTINANPIIYIDTSALMENADLRLFIKKGKSIFHNEHRHIIVLQAVYLELVKHLCSNDLDKQKKASQALNLIKEHQDIFEVRNQDFSEKQVYEAFADPEILAELNRNKKYGGQLLITNDQKLSMDAYEINSQKSCPGHQILVCHINHLGELRISENSMLSSEDIPDLQQISRENFFSETVKHTSIDENGNYPNDNFPVSKTKTGFSSWNILIPVGTYALGIISCKYGKAALRALNTYIYSVL